MGRKGPATDRIERGSSSGSGSSGSSRSSGSGSVAVARPSITSTCSKDETNETTVPPSSVQ